MVLPRTKDRRSDPCTSALTLTPRGMRWSGMKNRMRHLSSASTELVPSPDTPHSDKKLCRLHTFHEVRQHDKNRAGYSGFEGNTAKISMIETGELEVIILHTLLYLFQSGAFNLIRAFLIGFIHPNLKERQLFHREHQC